MSTADESENGRTLKQVPRQQLREHFRRELGDMTKDEVAELLENWEPLWNIMAAELRVCLAWKNLTDVDVIKFEIEDRIQAAEEELARLRHEGAGLHMKYYLNERGSIKREIYDSYNLSNLQVIQRWLRLKEWVAEYKEREKRLTATRTKQPGFFDSRLDGVRIQRLKERRKKNRRRCLARP